LRPILAELPAFLVDKGSFCALDPFVAMLLPTGDLVKTVLKTQYVGNVFHVFGAPQFPDKVIPVSPSRDKIGDCR